MRLPQKTTVNIFSPLEKKYRILLNQIGRPDSIEKYKDMLEHCLEYLRDLYVFQIAILYDQLRENNHIDQKSKKNLAK